MTDDHSGDFCPPWLNYKWSPEAEAKMVALKSSFNAHRGVTRITEPPPDVERIDRYNRAWLADDERAQRLPECMRPELCDGRECWGCP